MSIVVAWTCRYFCRDIGQALSRALVFNAMNTPVVFLVFNRPEVTARVFARIREARPKILFVVADGPRVGRIGEVEKCAEVRRLISAGIDWPCRVVWECSDVNLGCARRVSSGLNLAFAEVEEAIILEDDCLPDPTFFRFCEELLILYRDQPKVAQIAGCSFQDPMTVPEKPGYYFSRYPHCWGWATWRRAWQHYDHEMRAGYLLLGGDWMVQAFEQVAERRWWAVAFKATAEGRIDSWAFRWSLTVMSRGWLGVLPYHNLVSNIGSGSHATHTKNESEVMALPTQAVQFPLMHPSVVHRDIRADDYSSRRLFRTRNLALRVLRRLRLLFSR